MTDNTQSKGAPQRGASLKVAIFGVVVAAWLVIDLLTKSLFKGQEPGGILAGPFLGLIDIRLVHNTGAAWGMFSNSTFALGIFSVIACALLIAYFFYALREMNMIQTIGFALVVSGGLGNAIDRFVQGYVIDFIEFAFMDFPVFNVADIGVTCGFAIVIIGLIVAWKADADRSKA